MSLKDRKRCEDLNNLFFQSVADVVRRGNIQGYVEGLRIGRMSNLSIEKMDCSK